ncbi:MAG: bile acid:sodium symporter family protein [Erythrobacter sp.]
MIGLATRLFAFWTVAGTMLAWFVPPLFLWVVDGSFAPLGQPLVSVMLGVIMLGMGLTLTLDDFKRVIRLPRAVMTGVALQFTVMPLAGITLATAFGLQSGLAVGLVLVACCPGGTASNVVAYLARANVALSVTMTMVSTLVAVIATPLLTGWLAGVFVEIDRWALFRSMVTVVLVPVVLGVALRALLPQATKRIEPVAPLVSVLFVVLIVGAIVARSKDLISEHAGVLLLALFLLHVIGFALGYVITRLLGFDEAVARTASIEVGMQNSGLGSTLAAAPSFAAQFVNPLQAALAPVPSAISAVYHVVIGSLLASWWRRRSEKED